MEAAKGTKVRKASALCFGSSSCCIDDWAEYGGIIAERHSGDIAGIRVEHSCLLTFRDEDTASKSYSTNSILGDAPRNERTCAVLRSF